jgi:hypothetical protein
MNKKLTGSDKKKVKKHRDFLRGLENRREQYFFYCSLTHRLIIANRATHNQHEKELEELEKQIVEWKQKIAEESGTTEKKTSDTTGMEEA